MIAREELDALRRRINILDVIGRYVKLKQDGREWIGPCCFHQEKTASFKVDPNKDGGVYICFGCDSKGDVFKFVQEMENLTFPETVKRMRELAGVEPVKYAAPGPTQKQSAKAAAPAGKLVATYVYTDENGKTLLEVLRYDPKTFRQRAPNGQGGWNWKIDGVRRPLYFLPEVLKASEVFIVEGEKDVHTLRALGLCATTAPGGSKSPWMPEYTAALTGKDVIIIPDNDEPGRARGEQIATALAGKAERVTTVTLPDVFKDVTEYIEAGNVEHDLQKLVQISRTEPEPEPVISYAPLETGEQLEPNDIGRLIMRDHVLVADQSGYIFEYNHRHWRRITKQQAIAYAMQYDTHKHTKARRRQEAAEYAITSCHVNEIPWRNIAAHEIPVLNGVVDLKTGELREHRKEDYLEHVPPYRYTGRGACPEWLGALALYWEKDADYQAKLDALQEFMGYCLMMHARYKKALVLYGEGDTGKSQIPFVIRKMVGDKNTCAVSVEDMDDSRRRAPLVGKAVNILTELTSRSTVADGGFKTLISTEEPLEIDPKYDKPIMYAPIAKHVIVCNNLPKVNDLTRATFNRLLLLRFNHEIPAEKKDRNIMDRLEREIEGVLFWSIQGARRLFENGGEFTRVTESEETIADYRDQENPVNDFIAEQCSRVLDAYPILISEFTKSFNAWNRSQFSSKHVASLLRGTGLTVKKVQDRGPLRLKRCVYGLEMLRVTDSFNYEGVQ